MQRARALFTSAGRDYHSDYGPGAADGTTMTTNDIRNQEAVAAICRHLRMARRLLFITGAGISADSGLPTYRGIGGLYEEQVTDEGLPIEVALSGEMFREEPHITWKYLAQIERACRGATFNDAHRVISEMQRAFEVCVLTQNVDGFHRRAGSGQVIEMHGAIHRLWCRHCGAQEQVEDFAHLQLPPRCGHCHAIVRPRVVLFNEELPRQALLAWSQAWERGFDMVFTVGTTSVFPYIAEPVLDAARMGVPTVEINPDRSQVSELVAHRLRGGAALWLRRLWDTYRACEMAT